MLSEPVQTPPPPPTPHVWFNGCVERILKQMLKPFKRTLTGTGKATKLWLTFELQK